MLTTIITHERNPLNDIIKANSQRALISVLISSILQAHLHRDGRRVRQHPDSLPGRQPRDTVLAAWTAVLAL